MLPFILGHPPRPSPARRSNSRRSLAPLERRASRRPRVLLLAPLAVATTVLAGLAIGRQWSLIGLAIALTGAVLLGREIWHALERRPPGS
jgi:hypothetical protein